MKFDMKVHDIKKQAKFDCGVRRLKFKGHSSLNMRKIHIWFQIDNFSNVWRILMKFDLKVHGIKTQLSSISEYVGQRSELIKMGIQFPFDNFQSNMFWRILMKFDIKVHDIKIQAKFDCGVRRSKVKGERS